MALRGASVLFELILVLNVLTCHSSAVYSPSGPVYVNPNAAPVQAVKAQPAVIPTKDVGNFITQTVYGFLDFTTTIGNTVMIFSPQSAAPAPQQTVQTFVTTVIETKPPATVVASTVKSEIKPSKTVVKSTEKPPVVSSVVKVVSSPPVLSSIVNVQKPIVSKVEVFSSHVEVRGDNPKPSNIPASPVQKKEIVSKVEVKKPVILSSRVDVNVGPSSVVHKNEEHPVIYSSVVEVHTSEEEEPVLQIGNNIGEPEYDFLSRQPAEFVEETYRVVNLRPSANAKFLHKPRQTVEPKRARSRERNDDSHPTGLVTKLGGTVVKDGVTTVHETSVIGTYISGKYAQVLQSTSQIIHSNPKPKPTPSSSLRILKTAAPTIPKGNRHAALEATPVNSNEETAGLPLEALFVGNSQSPNLVRSSRRPANPTGSFKNRFHNRNNKDEVKVQEISEEPPVHHHTTAFSSGKKSQRNRNSKPKNSRFNRHSTTSVELATVSVFSETAQPTYSSRRNKINHRDRHTTTFKPTTTQAPANEGFTRRGYKPKVHPTALDDQSSTSLYKFKLNRTPGRWQYKTTPKPRVTIRKQNGDADTNIQSSTPMNEIAGQNDYPTTNSRQEDTDLESSSSINGNILNDVDASENGIEKKYPVETVKVEISTPADFKDTYYEIATIKSPYTFQVGSIKNTRYVTVTSTFEKVLEQESTSISPSNTEPLTENILATTSHIDKEHNLLDSSIATLPPIALSGDAETPPLETLTETFSTTQIMLKTHILPVIRAGGNTTSYTLIQTYHVTRLVTATKTLPPMEAYQFVPSKTLNEFNSRLDEAGSELHLELDFGDDENDEDEPPRREFPSDLDLSNIGSDFDLSEVDKSNIPEGLLRPKKKVSQRPTEPPMQLQQIQQGLSNEQIQQLAILRLLNPGAAQQIQQVITTSKPIVKLETVFESHVIPIFNGFSTSYSTISRPIATVSKTEYEYGTSTLGVLPQVLPQGPVNPFQQQQQQQQQQFQITSTPVVTQTVITATESKILKLTFGAKTAYTTLFSTRVVPTMLTTYVTGSVPVQPTAQVFPGYFPAPYPPYPYVG